MEEKIFEVAGNNDPGIMPVQVEARSNSEPKIENLGGSSIDPEPITVLDSEPIKREFKVGQPLTEDDKARAVMNPFEKKKEKPKLENATLDDIPGAQVIPVAKDQPYKDQGIILADDNGKPIEDVKFKSMLKEMISGDLMNKLIRRFELQNINLAEEKALIDAKKSHLSKSRREAVIALWNMKQLQRRTLEAIAKPMIKKESPTEEDVKKILDEVEEDVTNHENAAKIVAHDIVQRALANKAKGQAEVPAEVKEALESAKVDYTPGEGGNDEVTSKALHDAVRDHGRTKFRGVFSSLDMVKDPQVGDVIHTIATDANGNHAGLEMVFTYIGPNHWRCDGSVHVDLPEEPKQEEKKKDLSESMNDFVVRG